MKIGGRLVRALLSDLTLFPIAICFLAAGACSQPAPDTEAFAADNGPADEATNEAHMQLWYRDEAVVADLALSDRQVESIKEIYSESGKQLTRNNLKERKAYTIFLRTLNQDPVDEKALAAAAKRFEATVAAKTRLTMTRLTNIRSVLTREQWFKLMELRPQAFRIAKINPLGRPGSGQEPVLITK
jgi:Spy/CpxP family protein refolding chaperone